MPRGTQTEQHPETIEIPEEDESIEPLIGTNIDNNNWDSLEDNEAVEKLKEKDLPKEIFSHFVDSENWEIRQAIALNEQTPPEIIEKLENDDDDVQEAIAFRALPHQWRKLGEYETIKKLKEENNIDLPIIKIFANSNNPNLRAAIAILPYTPTEILGELCHDDDPYVKDAIAFRELPDEWRKLDAYEISKKLKEENNIDLPIIKIFANSYNHNLRAAIAIRPSTDADTLEKLRNDDYPFIRQFVAENNSTAEKILNELRQDDDEDVRKAANKSLRKLYPDFDEYGEEFVEEIKTIYMKTEPGGHVLFGQIESDEIKLLSESLKLKELNEELEEIPDNSYGSLMEADGVVNNGDEGDFGNEGTIVFSEYISRLGPEDNENGGGFKDGIYAVIMKLSKCSIEFDFSPKGAFDADKFEEICVPVILPDEIAHGLYGHPEFNIITGFKYDGEEIDEEYEVVDRGYDQQFTFFAIKGGKTTIIYSNYNGDEEWNDSDEALEILESSEEVESNDDDNEKGSYDIEKLSDEFKEALCNSLAVAGIEDVIGRDPSEVWTVLGEDQPSGYNYESDEHTDIIEKAGNLLSNELLESLAEGIDIFEEKINENRGYISFWELFLELDQTDDIDEFNEALYNILEEIA